MQVKPKSALIVKLGALGDAVMALPAVPTLRHAGYSHVAWLCGNSIEPLLRLISCVNELITVDDEVLFKGSPGPRLAEFLRLWARLRGSAFDLVLTFHGNRSYRLLTLPLLHSEHRRLGYRGLRPPIPGRHHSNEYVRLAAGRECPGEESASLPVVRPGLPEWLSTALKRRTDRASIALAPGGARNVYREDALRRWPQEHYVKLAAKLTSDGAAVVLTGSVGDAWVSEAFRGLPVIDAIGKTGIEELLGVYAACDAVVTHDSGPLHLAQLARAPLVALFGPTTPRERILHLSGGRVFWGGEGLACRPCYDGRGFAQCSNNTCLKEIDVESVYAAITEIVRVKREVLSRES